MGKLQRKIQKYSVPAMWAAGVLTILGLVFSRLPGWGAPATAVYLLATVLAGVPILFRAVQSLRFRVVGIEVLVSIAVLGAACIGEFSEGAVVTFLFQFGSYLEQKTMAKTRSAIKALTALAPTTAWRYDGDELEEIDAEDVEEGDTLLVKTGSRIAADGIVTKGEGYVTEAGITGEPTPKHKAPGDQLYAGTVLESGTLDMLSQRVGEDTSFSKIIQLVEEAQDAKSPAERFIDKFARYYTPAVVVLALLVLLLTRNLDMAITVLVLACPGALVIGAPIANVAGIGRGAREGVLLKGGDSIDVFAKTDTFVFDKTGTLTQGKPSVTALHAYGMEEAEALALAAGAEAGCEHPLAWAVVDAAKEKNMAIPKAEDIQVDKGLGVSAKIGQHRVCVGSRRYLEGLGVAVPENVEESLPVGGSRVLCAVDGALVLAMSVADPVKEDAAKSIAALRKKARVVMLTGDHPQAAEAVAKQLGILEYHGGLLPQDKAAAITKLRQEGHIVTFVGDGINDSPALTTADTGIAMGSGTDVAVDCSQVVLMGDRLSGLPTAWSLAKGTVSILHQNIAIAVGTVIALLVGLFAGFIHMGLGMLIHEGSILVVIFNAMRIGRKKL